MTKLRTRVAILLLLSLFQISSAFALNKQVIGWLENVKIDNSDFQLKAKIDSGATTSSLNAKIIKKFTKNGKKWVRFRIKNKLGQEIILEKRIIRNVKIKRKLALSIKRPVIKLGVCLGNVYRAQEVNLSDRNNFEFHMLIGRNFLKGYFLIDSELEYTTAPTCENTSND